MSIQSITCRVIYLVYVKCGKAYVEWGHKIKLDWYSQSIDINTLYILTHCGLVTFCGVMDRVGFLPEEMYFFQDTRKKLENSYFFQFLPEETGWNGRNWKKLKSKNAKYLLVSNITSTHISVFIKDGINLFTDSTFQFPHQPNVKDAAISELRV